MILAICVDDRMGLSFCSRRLSKDRVIREKLTELSGGKLRMSMYSAKQFENEVYSGEDYLTGSAEGDWCFAENDDYLAAMGSIEKIVLFRWNRAYPADLFFRIPEGWHMTKHEDFPGNSHEIITMEVYEP